MTRALVALVLPPALPHHLWLHLEERRREAGMWESPGFQLISRPSPGQLARCSEDAAVGPLSWQHHFLDSVSTAFIQVALASCCGRAGPVLGAPKRCPHSVASPTMTSPLWNQANLSMPSSPGLLGSGSTEPRAPSFLECLLHHSDFTGVGLACPLP